MIRFSNVLLLSMLFVAPAFGQQMSGPLNGTTPESRKAYMEQYCKTNRLICGVDANGEIVEFGAGGVTSIVTGLPSFSTLITPKCPEGYSMVFRSNGQAACAKEIIEPQ
jgi:hypothetical protein